MKRQGHHIRVFLSSTFSDMTSEHEYLDQVVFPEVRALALERGVQLSVIDLYRGVAEPDARQGDALAVHLEAIDRCDACVISLLGERYGEVVSQGDVRDAARLIERFPESASHLEEGVSVVELQLQHGVFAREGELSARFYQRDPTLTEQLAQGQERATYYEGDQDAQERLTQLKQRISDHGCALHSYDQIEAMGQHVKDDLIALLDERCPESETLGAVEAERREHRAYAEALASSFMPQQETIQVLRDIVKRAPAPGALRHPLLITGPSGCGKSALIAYWLTELKAESPGQWVIEHYAGADHDHRAAHVLTRLINEIKAQVAPDNAEPIPTDFEKLCAHVNAWLDRIPADRPLVLVIDAIDHIKAPSSRWIPTHLPAHITCVMSAAPGKRTRWLEERDAEFYEVPALDVDARRAIAEDYLARHHKTCSSDQLDRVINAEPCQSPLFLTTILGELVSCMRLERLSDHIDRLVDADELDTLFDHVFVRLEEDYGQDLTQGVLTALWASRSGLSEEELMGITDSSLIDVLKITFALDPHLSAREGLIQFRYSALEGAVRDRYMSRRALRQRCHGELASWFREHTSGARRAHTLHAHTYFARDWSQLHKDLTDPQRGPEAVRYLQAGALSLYWAKIHEHLDLTMEAEYERVWLSDEDSWREPDVKRGVADLLAHAGRASDFQEQLKLDDDDDQEESNENLQRAQERLEASRALAKEQDTPEHLHELCVALKAVGELHTKRGELDEALAVSREHLKHARALAHKQDTPERDRDLAESLNTVGDLAKDAGKPDEARNAYREALKSSRMILKRDDTPENQRELSLSLDRVGHLAKEHGKMEEALEAYQESLEIARALADQFDTPQYHREHSISLNHLGDLAEARGEIDKAVRIYQESINLIKNMMNDRDIFMGMHAIITTMKFEALQESWLAFYIANFEDMMRAGDYQKIITDGHALLNIFDDDPKENMTKLASISRVMGWAYLFDDHNPEAEHYFQIAIPFAALSNSIEALESNLGLLLYTLPSSWKNSTIREINECLEGLSHYAAPEHYSLLKEFSDQIIEQVGQRYEEEQRRLNAERGEEEELSLWAKLVRLFQ